jgi:signal transduction histidine kinase/ligand-binding sensor domain-containing protein
VPLLGESRRTQRGNNGGNPRERSLRTAPLWLLGALLHCGSVWARDADLGLHQLTHRAYTAAEGAPSMIYAMAQTNDGMLWLGSSSGLTRFDGQRFVRYPGPLDDPLPSLMVGALIAAPDGGLWIGYRYGGYSLLKAGRLTHFGVGASGGVRQFAWDRDGTLWAVSSSDGLQRFNGGLWERVTSDSIPYARAVVVDAAGNLWVGTRDRILVRRRGEAQFREAAKVSSTYNVDRFLAASKDGSVWAIEDGAIARINPPWNPRPAGKRMYLGPGAFMPLLFDDRGGLWVGGDPLRRIRCCALVEEQNSGESPVDADQFNQVDGLTAGYAVALLLDREHNVWAATNSGLNRFSRSNVAQLPLPLCPGPGYALAAGDGGTLWAACARVDSAVGFVFEIRNGSVASRQDAEDFTAAYRDAGGTVWFAGPKALGHLEGGRIVTTPLPVEARGVDAQAIARDRSGAVWLSMSAPKSVYRFADGQWTFMSELPHYNTAITEAVTSDDAVWFGYARGALARWRGKSVHTFTAADGLNVGNITALRAQGAQLWVGGPLGLEHFDGRRFVPIRGASSNAFTGVTGIVATESGDLWLNAIDGIVYIRRQELERAALDPNYRVQNETFNALDGVPGTPVDVRPLPSAIETTDGRVWFATNGGVVSIDAAYRLRNALPPPVKIWSLGSHGRFFAPVDGLALPAHSDSLQIDYSAGSLVVPERVHFRYKLEGLDRDWQDAGNRREALYTNLSPGHYRFQVIASNNDGVWNRDGASVEFTIRPAFYQSKWFYTLCGLLGLALLVLLYRLRVRQVSAQIRLRLGERLAERERIARDLHDTLLQGVQGLIWRFQAATDRIPRNEKARELLEQSIERADRLLAESRDRVKNLRDSPTTAVELSRALAAEGQELALAGPAQFKTRVEGLTRELHPIVREEAFLIAREALANAFRHSAAQHIEAEVIYGQAALEVRVRDDGRGFGSAALQDDANMSHFGLRGMRERAQRIRSHLVVWSKPDIGTEIDLRVQADVAYEGRGGAPGRAWWRRAVAVVAPERAREGSTGV